MPLNDFFIKSVHSGKIEDKQFKGVVSPSFIDTLRILSFEFINDMDPKEFQKKLQSINVSLCIAGVESTMLQPADTFHKLIGVKKKE